MAKVDKNIVIQGLSGSLGDQLVIQTGRGGQTIICSKPHPDGKAPSIIQQTTHEKFQESAAYAKAAKENLVLAAKAALKSRTTHNVARADWFHPPEVVTIDLESWSGKSGEKLRVRLRDSVRVKMMYFLIAQEDGTLVEEGPGTPIEDGVWWEYVTTADHPGCAAKVLVSAQDLPGHEADLESEKKIT